jgi:hypothetical protein
MQVKQGKKVLSTSNVLFGMNHFMKFYGQLNSIHKLGFHTLVEMIFCV